MLGNGNMPCPPKKSLWERSENSYVKKKWDHSSHEKTKHILYVTRRGSFAHILTSASASCAAYLNLCSATVVAENEVTLAL